MKQNNEQKVYLKENITSQKINQDQREQNQNNFSQANKESVTSASNCQSNIDKQTLQADQQESNEQEEIKKQLQKRKKKQFPFFNNSIIFTVDDHYLCKKIIGRGIYGIVASGQNLQSKQQVAIKQIPNLFNHFGDTKRMLRQIKVLKFLRHKNIVALKDIMKIQNPLTFNQIYLCMEFMQFDLHKLIHSSTKITEQMTKFIMFQLLVALNYMHSADILHRDLKPQNILMNKKCQLKLADMNLARKQTYAGDCTDYVASRPYRAPQVLIGSPIYSKSIDIWSVGCIFAQLLGKTVIFQGKDFIDQLKRFVAILGKPKIQYFPHIQKSSMDSLAKLIKQIPDKQKVQWKYLMPNANQKALDLLDRMLVYDSTSRYTTEQCLNHPYLQQYKKFPRSKCNQVFDFSFDKIQMKADKLRQAIYQQAQNFHQKKRQRDFEAQQDIKNQCKKKIQTN